ncbi:MAG: hypothetical protein ACXACG_05185 [Candidatus Thorarchaeota archaeon]
MTDRPGLTIQRDLDDIKFQVKKELDTIRDLMDSFGYRNPAPTWNAPFQIHRLRRALRIHYLALKIRDSTPQSPSMRNLSWDLRKDHDLP